MFLKFKKIKFYNILEIKEHYYYVIKVNKIKISLYNIIMLFLI